jgi:prepilin-type N-terminal cleavage/methylation domain-containing protein
MKKMNKKGFTLIELLAVIVILGLLMAIAIPSVTKYITQSRKKTLTSTIGNYMSALTNEVNNLEYTFTASNTIYAVPIECVALERGGSNPFGTWMDAGANQWGYVLVQYDDATSSYIYGFTFKDTAGYGLYPTVQSKLNSKGDQILTTVGKALKETNSQKPATGKAKDYTAKANWTGFVVYDGTETYSCGTEAEPKTCNRIATDLVVLTSTTSAASQENGTCLKAQQ